MIRGGAAFLPTAAEVAGSGRGVVHHKFLPPVCINGSTLENRQQSKRRRFLLQLAKPRSIASRSCLTVENRRTRIRQRRARESRKYKVERNNAKDSISGNSGRTRSKEESRIHQGGQRIPQESRRSPQLLLSSHLSFLGRLRIWHRHTERYSATGSRIVITRVISTRRGPRALHL